MKIPPFLADSRLRCRPVPDGLRCLFLRCGATVAHRCRVRRGLRWPVCFPPPPADTPNPAVALFHTGHPPQRVERDSPFRSGGIRSCTRPGTGNRTHARRIPATTVRRGHPPEILPTPARPRGHRHRLVRRQRARGMDEPGGYGTSRYTSVRAGGMVAAVRTGGVRSTGGTPRADERPPALVHTLHFG